MKIGRYQILEQLGRGAMGIVYKAYDPTIARTVAIKAIRLGEFADVEERHRVQERILREAQSAGLLSHPSIVTIYDVLEQEDSAYIFMEFVRGRSLDNLLRDSHLPPVSELLRYLLQVADALDSAHRRGVIHRDIKPGNIILAEPEGSGEKRAKVADFGVAKFISQDTTHSGTMMGTPAYMSPEQIQGLISDGRSDQFSLAVVIYELLTGVKPFAGDGLPTLFYQICKVEPKPAHEFNTALPEAVSRVLGRALSKESAARFVSCSAFVGALEDAFVNQAPVLGTPAGAGNPVLTGGPGEGFAPAARPDVPVFVPASRRLPDAGDSRSESLMGSLLGSLLDPRMRVNLALVVAVCIGIILAITLRHKGGTPSSPVTNGQSKAEPAKTEAAPSPSGKATPPAQPTQLPPSGAQGEPALAPPAASVSDATILSNPPGSQVVIDDRETTSCIAPCTLPLPRGRHTLTASHDGYNLARKVFNVPEEILVNVTLRKKEGILFLKSDPAGSDVFVDGKNYGKTPVTLKLSAGEHEFLLVNGESRHKEMISIENDGIESRTFRW